MNHWDFKNQQAGLPPPPAAYVGQDPETCPVIDPNAPVTLLQAAQLTLQKYGTLDPGWEPLRRAVAAELEAIQQHRTKKYTIDDTVAIVHPTLDGTTLEVKPAKDDSELHTFTLRMDITDVAPLIADAAIELGVYDAREKFRENK